MNLNVTALLSKLTRAAGDTRQAAQSITSSIAELRAAIVAKHRELEQARGGPRPAAEIRTERVPQAVAEAGAAWLHDYGSSLLHGERALGSPDPAPPRLPWSYREPIPWAALCAGHPAFATEILDGLVRSLPAWNAGPAEAERPAAVERLGRELAELEALEEQTIDDASAAGVVVQHRTEVLQRRESERRARERADRAAEDRAAREAALNERHAAQSEPRVARWPRPQ